MIEQPDNLARAEEQVGWLGCKALFYFPPMSAAWPTGCLGRSQCDSLLSLLVTPLFGDQVHT